MHGFFGNLVAADGHNDGFRCISSTYIDIKLVFPIPVRNIANRSTPSSNILIPSIWTSCGLYGSNLARIWRQRAWPLVVNIPGNPRVKISDPYPYLLDPYPSIPRVYPSKNDQKRPKQSRNEGDMLKLLFYSKWIISHSKLNRFGCSKARFKSDGYGIPYPYPYPPLY
jgi:hypothetical protein